MIAIQRDYADRGVRARRDQLERRRRLSRRTRSRRCGARAESRASPSTTCTTRARTVARALGVGADARGVPLRQRSPARLPRRDRRLARRGRGHAALPAGRARRRARGPGAAGRGDARRRLQRQVEVTAAGPGAPPRRRGAARRSAPLRSLLPLLTGELTQEEIANLLLLLVAGAGLLVLVPRIGIPYPILLVSAGWRSASCRACPHVGAAARARAGRILPPLLYSSAFFTSLRDSGPTQADHDARGRTRAPDDGRRSPWWRTRSSPGLPWSAAFVLGAIVSPTDPIAATAIIAATRRCRGASSRSSRARASSTTAPRSSRTGSRVAAVVTGSFSLWRGGARRSSSASPAASRSVSRSAGRLARCGARLDDPPTEITISLLTGYFAYLPAEAARRVGRYRSGDVEASTSAGTRRS